MTALFQIPIFTDNYVYVVVDGHDATVIDPGDAEPVLAFLKEHGLRLEAILLTHHHPDHIGGVETLRTATGCLVAGPARDAERLPRLDVAVEVAVDAGAGGETHVEIAGRQWRVFDVAAHTMGHVAWAFDDGAAITTVTLQSHDRDAVDVADLAGRPLLFVGDSLFAAGCGRLFEGTAKDLHRALSRLASQSPRSLVCCAHEYTASNLAFAAAILPGHEGIRRRRDALPALRAAQGSSVPMPLSEELATNPFLLGLASPNPEQRVFELRRQKDSFNP